MSELLQPSGNSGHQGETPLARGYFRSEDLESLTPDQYRDVVLWQQYGHEVKDERLQTLEEEAEYDPLTLAYKKEVFMAALTFAIEAMNFAGREEDPEAIVVKFIDLLNFKEVNDAYGHDVGDQTLWYAAANIMHSLRQAEDMCGRMGGDEFANLIPVTKATDAAKVSKNIDDRRKKNIRYRNVHRAPGEPKIYLSVGTVIVYRGTSMTAEEVVKWADAEMYRKKALQHAALEARQQEAG